ncbi:MAG: hypothetical protein ACFFAG_13310 [Promethearchaeota archaeon]
MENRSYFQELHEFRILLNKVVIPFEQFFKSDEKNIYGSQILDIISSEIET